MSGSLLQNEYLADQLENERLDANVGLNNSGLGLNNNLAAGSRLSTGLVRAEPTILETIQKETVVHERIHPIQKEEIQPIIYREREQLDVKQVTQMMHETHIQPTLIQQRELPAQTREAVVERGAPIQENLHFATREVDATTRSQVVHAPIVNEVIKKTIIEEIQPVLERDIIQSTVIQNTQPIYEKIVEAPTVYREVMVHAERRLSGGSLEALAAQGFNLGTYGQTAGLTTSTGLNSGLVMNNGLAMNNDIALNNGLGREAVLDAGLAQNSTTYVSGSRRKSLLEALPASYSYLGQDAGLNTEAKLAAEANLASRPLATEAPLTTTTL